MVAHGRATDTAQKYRGWPHVNGRVARGNHARNSFSSCASELVYRGGKVSADTAESPEAGMGLRRGWRGVVAFMHMYVDEPVLPITASVLDAGQPGT